MMLDLRTIRTSEWIVCGFFACLLVLSRVRPLAPGARRRALLVSAVCIALPLMLSQLRASPSLAVLRAWLPAAYLLQGYWLCGLFYRGPMRGVEQWLLDVDARLLGRGRLGRLASRMPRSAASGFELAYLLAYPFVPAGFGLFLALGGRARADDFWTAALIAAFGCYGALPWLQTRPPRALAGQRPLRSPHPGVRRLNEAVLRRMSVQVNTVPSGHAATATAVALAVCSASPPAGAALLAAAACIVAGTVIGRYHYAVDSLSGVLVGVAGWWIAFG